MPSAAKGGVQQTSTALVAPRLGVLKQVRVAIFSEVSRQAHLYVHYLVPLVIRPLLAFYGVLGTKGVCLFKPVYI